MKILATSDWHVDATTAGIKRAPELDRYVDVLCERLDRGDVDVLVHLGDYFDPGTLSESRWTTTLMRHVRELHSRVRRSVWICGNHDVVDSSAGWSTLSPLREAAENDWLGDCRDGGPNVCEYPTAVQTAGVVFLALPFVSRATERTDGYLRAREIALDLAGVDRHAKLVVLGHFTIPGIVPGSEEEMARGREMVFPAEEIAALKPDVVLSGHYHARQTVACGGVRIEIPGAPLRMTFGERDDGERGWLEIDL